MMFDFRMPLNFMMLKDDFRILFQNFHHGHTFAKYLTNIYLDSLFTLEPSHTYAKQAAANELVNYYRQEVRHTEALLQKYEHLVETEQIDCELEFSGLSTRQRLVCHFRKYLATLLSLGTIVGLTLFAYNLRLRSLNK